jgi:hypothetical protein
MPRLVIPRHAGAGSFAAEKLADVPPDKYKDRLVKYIPAESVALYAFTDKLLIAYYGIDANGVATKIPADGILQTVSWGLFILGLLGTPIYLYKQRLSGQPWELNAAISTIAFALWVYTLGGSLILLHHWYNVLLAGIAAPVFTFIAGWFEPKAS